MVVRDAHGNELRDGDAVQVLKDIRVKGSSDTVTTGTVFKNIRLNLGDAESVECGQGRNIVVLQTCFIRRAN